MRLIGTEVKLRTGLKRVKCANDNPHKYRESKMKDCEEEKEILIWNQELQKELEAIKTNVPVQNLQLVGSSSQPQQGHQCGIHTAHDGKVSSHNFQFIRRLGEGAFGTAVLAKGKLPGGHVELYAIKVLKNEASPPAASLRLWLRRNPRCSSLHHDSVLLFPK
jgi:hypothetical protein